MSHIWFNQFVQKSIQADGKKRTFQIYIKKLLHANLSVEDLYIATRETIYNTIVFFKHVSIINNNQSLLFLGYQQPRKSNLSGFETG